MPTVERPRRFLGDPGRALPRERREQLVERWRHTREARERLPDPVSRVYRVMPSTSWAVLDGRDAEHILSTTLGAVAGTVAHATHAAVKPSYRDAQRHARSLTWAVVE